MAAIAPMDAVADAVAAYFDAEVPGLKVIRGWPERNEDLDLFGTDDAGGDYRAVLSVVASPRYDTERVNPVEVQRTANAGTGEYDLLYRVALITGRIQLDLWAPYRSARDEFAALILEKSTNQVPQSSDLRVVASGFYDRDGYYDRPAKIDLEAVATEDNGGDIEVGQWRRTWSGEVSTDLVVPKSHPKILDITHTLETTLGGVSVTDTLTITP